MKKLVLLGLCLVSPLIAMENTKPDWDAEAYKNANWVQEQAARSYVKEKLRDLAGKGILDVGCGCGNNSAWMARMANCVLGVDASESMITLAMKMYTKIENLGFIKSSAEEIAYGPWYDIVTSFFCLPWVRDKKRAIQNMYNSLKPDGQALFTITTTSNDQPILMKVFADMLPELVQKLPALRAVDMSKLSGRSTLTDDELEGILKGCGFTSWEKEHKIINPLFDSREQIAAWVRPLVTNIPLMAYIPEEAQDHLFEKMLDNLMRRLTENDEGKYIYPLDTILVLATK